MILRRLPALSRWMAAAVLVVLLPFLRPPFAFVALILLAMHLGLARIRPAGREVYELAAALVHTSALPFVAGSVWPAGRPIALLALLGLPWLAGSLRRLAGAVVEGQGLPALHAASLRVPGGWLGGRRPTRLLLALVAGLLVQAFVGVAAERWVLLDASGMTLILLGALVASSLLGIPSRFLAVQPPLIRVLARDTVKPAVRLTTTARLPIGVRIEAPFPWVAVTPSAFAIAGTDVAREGQEVRLGMTPPLAGPGVLTAIVMAVDPWCLTTTRQDVDLARLQVIPRAAYAAWLARRYLESAQAGGGASIPLPALGGGRGPRRGLEYYGARSYEPGDTRRDIFWKQTLKLGRLVIKERRDDYCETVVVIANLVAPDAEAADWIAYSLLMSALTLAQEGVPVAFAAYTASGVVDATIPLSPRLAVTKALSLAEALQVTPPPARVLRPSRIALLRRTVALLSARRPEVGLARVLAFEYTARMRRATEHPAAAALQTAASRAGPPAAVLVISTDLGSIPEEADALEVTLERLGRGGFHPIGFLVPDGPAKIVAATAG